MHEVVVADVDGGPNLLHIYSTSHDPPKRPFQTNTQSQAQTHTLISGSQSTSSGCFGTRHSHPRDGQLVKSCVVS